MPGACECGDPDAAACRDAFDAALAAEFGDPRYFAVHHLTVAAYQVQHPVRYQPMGGVEVLRRFVEEGITPDRMRRDLTQGAHRPGQERDDVTTTGAMRLTSVRHDDPDTYCADIARYASSVLAAVEWGRPAVGPSG